MSCSDPRGILKRMSVEVGIVPWFEVVREGRRRGSSGRIIRPEGRGKILCCPCCVRVGGWGGRRSYCRLVCRTETVPVDI